MCRVLDYLCFFALGLLCTILFVPPALAQNKAHITAQNFSVARTVTQEALLYAATQAKNVPDGEIWLEGADQCRTPLVTTDCSVNFDAAGIQRFIPPYWQSFTRPDGKARWNIRIQNKVAFLFATMSNTEMAALSSSTRASFSTALCRKDKDDKILCTPPLLEQRPDGSTENLTLPAEILSAFPSSPSAGGLVVSVIQVVP